MPIRTTQTVLLAAALAGCSPATTPPTNPEPVSTSGEHAHADGEHAHPEPSTAVSAAPSAAPSATVALVATTSASTQAADDKCLQLITLCHDVGHNGGEPQRCHEVGHAQKDEACAKDFVVCKAACEEAAKKAPAHGHAH